MNYTSLITFEKGQVVYFQKGNLIKTPLNFLKKSFDILPLHLKKKIVSIQISKKFTLILTGNKS